MLAIWADGPNDPLQSDSISLKAESSSHGDLNESLASKNSACRMKVGLLYKRTRFGECPTHPSSQPYGLIGMRTLALSQSNKALGVSRPLEGGQFYPATASIGKNNSHINSMLASSERHKPCISNRFASLSNVVTKNNKCNCLLLFPGLYVFDEPDVDLFISASFGRLLACIANLTWERICIHSCGIRESRFATDTSGRLN